MPSVVTLTPPRRAAALALALLAAPPVLAQTLCSTGVPAPTSGFRFFTYAVSTQHTFTVPCTGRASTLIYTPRGVGVDDLRDSGFTVRVVLRSGDGTAVLATSDATDQWYPGATVTFDLTSANVPLVAGTTYRWDLVSDRAISESYPLYFLPYVTTNLYANGQLYQDGATADGNDAQGWTVNVTTALPVELVSFTAAADGATARLAWTTASETNNAGFTVEQRTAAGWVAATGVVAGRGTTSERTDYRADVANLTPGRHTFRLRQTDLDGTSVVAGTVTVEIGVGGGEGRVTLLGSRAVRIETNAAQTVVVTVFDLLGRSVSMQATAVDGTAEVDLPSALAPGPYLVRVAGERFAETRRVVVR